MKKLFLLLLIGVLTAFTAACGANKQGEASNDQRIKVYTTVYPLTYFTERIGGEHVSVSSIYPPGSNEHSFEPTQKDMMNLADANLFFYIGLGLEGFVDRAQKSLKNEKVKFIETTKIVSHDKLDISSIHGHADEDHGHEGDDHSHEGEHAHGDTDPHVWLSPVISQDLALSIKDSLVSAQPENKDEFEKNYNDLVKELGELDKQWKEMADKASSKTFFVSHSAFGYIAGAYGLEQVSVAGLNSQDEPSQKELANLVELAKEKNIHYILFEQNVSSKLAEVIRKEIGAETLIIHNLSVLTKEDVQNKENYFTLMKRNVQVMDQALNNTK